MFSHSYFHTNTLLQEHRNNDQSSSESSSDRSNRGRSNSSDSNNSRRRRRYNSNRSDSGDRNPRNRRRSSGSSSSNSRQDRRRKSPSSDDNKYDSDNGRPVDSKRYREGSEDRYDRRKKNSEVTKPGLSGPLLSFKQFMDLQEKYIEMNEAEKYYNEYKSAYERKQSEIFFKVHKDDHWFQEKYHPKLLYKFKQEQIKQSQALAKRFNTGLENEEFKGALLENQENFGGGSNEENKQEKKDPEGEKISESPLFGFDANRATLYLKLIPTHISRWELLDAVKPTPGFMGLSMSEPLKTQDFVRYAWVTYDSDENCQKSKTILEKVSLTNFDLNPVISQSTTNKRVKVTPLLNKGCISRDKELSKKLIEVFDQQRFIEGNKVFENEDKRDERYQLDLQLLYLRRVHAFCFYCCEEYEDERMLASKCGPMHVRLMKIDSNPEEESKDLDEGEVFDENAPTLFEQQNNQKIQKLIDAGPKIYNDPSENEEVVEARTEYCKRKIKEVTADRYLCNLCEKLFRAPHYVEKHILNKHEDIVSSKVDKSIYEDLLFDTFIKNPSKFSVFILDHYFIQSETFSGGFRGGRYNNNFYQNRRQGYDRRDNYKRGRHDDNRFEGNRGRGLVHYDDPNQNKKSERQLTNYDELFD